MLSVRDIASGHVTPGGRSVPGGKAGSEDEDPPPAVPPSLGGPFVAIAPPAPV